MPMNLVGENKSGKKVLFGGLPKDIDKKELILSKYPSL